MTGRRRSNRRLKSTLAAVMVVGAVSCLTISVTYASFTSQATNTSLQTLAGTLVMSDTATPAQGSSPVTCTSNGTGTTGNVNSSCTALFSSSALLYPGSTETAKVAIANTGSIDATTLSLFMPSCIAGTSPGASTPGSDDPCAAPTDTGTGLQLVVQETDSTYTQNVECWYPVVTVGACSSASNYATKLPNSFEKFAQFVNTWDTAKALGSGPAHGAQRYFLVTVQLPTDAANGLQARQATFALTWHLTT